MISKTILIKGAVGALAIYAARAYKIPMVFDLVEGPGGTGPNLPVPAIMPKAGFGLEWAIAPAAVAWYITR